MRSRVTAVLTVAAALACAPGASGATVLRLDGAGPLRLGMMRASAVRTGWLSSPRTGCPLGGPPLPVVFRVAGPRAPGAIRGFAEFDRGRLRGLSFDRGVRTTTGVVVGRSSAAGMVARFRSAGFGASSQYVSTFAGTFVTVRREGREVLGGFATKGVVRELAIPFVPVCE